LVVQSKVVVKEINTLWQEFMYLLIDPNIHSGETFVEPKEYFHLD